MQIARCGLGLGCIAVLAESDKPGFVGPQGHLYLIAKRVCPRQPSELGVDTHGVGVANCLGEADSLVKGDGNFGWFYPRVAQHYAALVGAKVRVAVGIAGEWFCEVARFRRVGPGAKIEGGGVVEDFGVLVGPGDEAGQEAPAAGVDVGGVDEAGDEVVAAEDGYQGVVLERLIDEVVDAEGVLCVDGGVDGSGAVEAGEVAGGGVAFAINGTGDAAVGGVGAPTGGNRIGVLKPPGTGVESETGGIDPGVGIGGAEGAKDIDQALCLGLGGEGAGFVAVIGGGANSGVAIKHEVRNAIVVHVAAE